jgi:hypothetical protein
MEHFSALFLFHNRVPLIKIKTNIQYNKSYSTVGYDQEFEPLEPHKRRFRNTA